MTRRADEQDEKYIRSVRYWSGDTLCLKKHPTSDERPGFMGYSKFGVIVSSDEPMTVYLRGESPEKDFEQTVVYQTIDAMLDDGWVVD